MTAVAVGILQERVDTLEEMRKEQAGVNVTVRDALNAVGERLAKIEGGVGVLKFLAGLSVLDSLWRHVAPVVLS